MTPAPTPILERLKKLIAMANDQGSPEEAALASERMQKLLQEYNLTQADVESSGSDKSETAATAKRERTEHDRSALRKYCQDLMVTIAGNNFCMYFIKTKRIDDPRGRECRWDREKDDYVSQKRVKCHLLIGRSENVQASILMYDYLLDAMHGLLAQQGFEDLRSSEAKLWLLGCTETVCERLMEQRTGVEAKQELDGTPGLVRLADLYGDEHDLNQDFRSGKEPGTTARERREEEAERAEVKRKEAELIATGMSEDDAYYLARGEEVPSTEPQQIREETPSQRRRREESEWNREQRERQNVRNKMMRDYERRNSSSFKAGRKRGHDIGLGGSLGSGAKALE